tara:strand:- start:26 stop:337 length:312 start_codon:yes stop_codon:yes gene_type:complete
MGDRKLMKNKFIDRAIVSFSETGGYKGYQGDTPQNENDFANLQPLEIHGVVWENTPPTWSEVMTKAEELEQEEQAKIDNKANAKAKLIAGEALTQEEADTIVL